MNRSQHSSWNIDPTSFPTSGNPRDQILFLLKYAVLAPSAHNTQPWKCKIDGSTLLVYFDSGHALTLSDPIHRQAYLSLGAFVATFIHAAKAFHVNHTCDWLPDIFHLNAPIARITIINPHQKNNHPDRELLEQITRRKVNRTTYQDKLVPTEQLEQIKACNNDPDLYVSLLQNKKDRIVIAEAVYLGMQFAFKNPQFRKELAAFVIPNYSSRPDGIPGHTANLGLVPSIIMPYVIRQFDIGKSQGKKEKSLFLSAPVIIVISSATDDLLGWLKAGALFQRIALLLTHLEIDHAISGAPIEAPLLPIKVQQVSSSNFRPQMVFRIGYGTKKVAHSRRRSVSDIVIK